MQKKELIKLTEILQCPISGGELTYDEKKNMFYSPKAKVFFPIENGIPMLLKSSSIAE
ncbi:MAG: Trm112 family protein [Alphaproteobacteria bacterium]|jgi:uncharacterized protein YbaR (Trm112 family)|nr:Trm112 family protein [Alphaproteobacteria bacterium]